MPDLTVPAQPDTDTPVDPAHRISFWTVRGTRQQAIVQGDDGMWHVVSDEATVAALQQVVTALVRGRDEARAEVAEARAGYTRTGNVWDRIRANKLDEAHVLLRRLVEHEDTPCVIDHNGYCQAHGLRSPPCAVAEARRLLGLDGPKPEHSEEGES
jgi:hypothetical protein